MPSLSMHTCTAGFPDRGSGTKFGSLAKFIWFFWTLFCVMHFDSGGSAFFTHKLHYNAHLSPNFLKFPYIFQKVFLNFF